MVDFTRLAGALEGNQALQRRARLAALSLTVLNGGEAIAVAVGERIAVQPGAAVGAAFSLGAGALRGEHLRGGEAQSVEAGTAGDEGDFVCEKHV